MFSRVFWFLIDYLVCESIDMGVPKVEVDGDKVSYELGEGMFAAAYLYFPIDEYRDGCRLETEDRLTGTLHCKDSTGVAFSLGYFACAEVKALASLYVAQRDLDDIRSSGSSEDAELIADSGDDVELELSPAEDEPTPFVFD